ncbi:hypothetical protein [Lacinutrix sp. MEBiC02404]
MMIKRLTNPENIDKSFIESEIESGNNVIIQFDEITYNDGILSDLNILAKKLDRNFEIRFYGHDKKTFDCKTLLKVNNVKNLSINCLKKVKNLNELSKLEHLEKLIIGIDDFKETEILNSDNFKSIQELNLATSKTKNLNLEYLKEYTNLTSLGISGNFKNTESIGQIENLGTLYLSGTNHKIKFDFVNQLKNLKELYLSFGSRENIDEIIGENLESLTILWIKNLNTLNISRFKKLKYLQVENQAQIESIEFNSRMNSLSKLKIINCKGLLKMEGLKELNSLKTLIISRSLKLEYENIINQELPKSLEHFNFYTARKAFDTEIKDRIRSLGYKTT